MKRRALAACAAVLVSLLPLPAFGATPRASGGPTLTTWTTVTGTKGYVDVRLAQPAKINLDFEKVVKPSYMQVVGDPDALVVLMQQAVVRGDAEAVWIPILKLPAAAGGRVIYMHHRDLGVPAGDYRLFLVAQRPSTVRFFLPGQVGGTTQLRASTPVAAARSAVEDAAAATDAASHHHANYLGYDVKRRAMAIGLTWSRSPSPPAARFTYACTYVGQPVAGRVLPGCPGAFLTFNEEYLPDTAPDYAAGYAVGPDPAGQIGSAVDLTILGPSTATGSKLYALEY